MRQLGVTGHYQLSGSAGITPGAGGETFAQWLAETFADTPVEAQAEWASSRWAHVAPWVRPVWMGSWDFVFAACAGLLALVWVGGELVARRGRIAAGVRRAGVRIRGRRN